MGDNEKVVYIVGDDEDFSGIKSLAPWGEDENAVSITIVDEDEKIDAHNNQPASVKTRQHRGPRWGPCQRRV